jgi:hypothetical protein
MVVGGGISMEVGGTSGYSCWPGREIRVSRAQRSLHSDPLLWGDTTVQPLRWPWLNFDFAHPNPFPSLCESKASANGGEGWGLLRRQP